jgi:hypothetical protein
LRIADVNKETLSARRGPTDSSPVTARGEGFVRAVADRPPRAPALSGPAPTPPPPHAFIPAPHWRTQHVRPAAPTRGAGPCSGESRVDASRQDRAWRLKACSGPADAGPPVAPVPRACRRAGPRAGRSRGSQPAVVREPAPSGLRGGAGAGEAVRACRAAASIGPCGPVEPRWNTRRTVRLSRRKASHEERNVDQRPPAGGKPHRDR